MVHPIGITVFFLIAPALVLMLCRRSRMFGKMGPVLTLYLAGVIVGNLGIIPGITFPESVSTVQHTLCSISVPLAIPLMLLGCTFDRKNAGGNIVSMLSCFAAVIIAVIAGYFIFRNAIGSSCMRADGAAKIAGVMAGAYTGGTINMAALKTMLNVTESTYLLLNGYDMLMGFLFLIFTISLGIKLFRFVLRDRGTHNDTIEEQKSDDNPYKGLGTAKGLRTLAVLTVYSLAVCALGYCVTLLFPKVPMMTVFILAITTFSIASSFITRLRNLPYSYDIGMYLIYIFSITVASMADVRTLDFAGGICVLGYLAFIIFVSLAIHMLISRLCHVDADIAVITSVALLCSPPFVPMISAAMRNRRVLAAGLAIGIVGYAVGNYLGFGIYRLFCE